MIKDRAESSLFSQFARDLLARQHSFRFQAKGRSMLPSIADGEILHVCPARGRRVRPGDIVLFSCGSKLKAHRVVRKFVNSFIAAGDAGRECDPEIPLSRIVGIVAGKECKRTGKYVKLFGFTSRLKFCMFRMRAFLRRTGRRVRADFVKRPRLKLGGSGFR
jgi:hypothetical protein